MNAGKLTIFTSYTPGAGKSHIMMSMAVKRAEAGKKVCIGFLNNRHRRFAKQPDKGYFGENIPHKYSLNTLISIMPDLIIMDEMGMYGINTDEDTFVYEDIERILALGIDVFTTANLKKFALANPLFKNITGIGIKKTIPDRFLDIADKIYFLDREPELMIGDFKSGKLFDKKHNNSKIMIKNFQPDTLKNYRIISLEFLEKYKDKTEVLFREKI